MDRDTWLAAVHGVTKTWTQLSDWTEYFIIYIYIKYICIYTQFSIYILILSCPLLLLPSVFPSIRVFSSESGLCIRWPEYWSFSFSISPSSEYSGLVSFRMDWLDLLAVQGTLKSLLQHHSSKASILRHSPFFMVRLSHPYMTTGKTIAWLDISLSAK